MKDGGLFPSGTAAVIFRLSPSDGIRYSDREWMCQPSSGIKNAQGNSLSHPYTPL